MGNITKKIIIFASISLVIVLLYSCASTSSVAKKITIESGEIPPDMKAEEFIIIGVLEGRRSYDKYVKKEFSKYSGNYILATKEEMSDKYSDVNKFRYYIDYDTDSRIMYNGKTLSTRYFIFDRKENKKYHRNSGSSFFALEMRAYLMAIEAIRKK